MNMDHEEITTREKIIIATIDFIEKYGVHAVTTRGIANEAKVNVAAINYYFGSKEKLLDETLKLTMKNLQYDIEEILTRKNQTPGEMLKSCLYFFLAGSMKYAGITNAHLYGLFVASRQDGPFVEFCRSMLSKLVSNLSECDSTRSREEIELLVAQVFSSVMTPSVFSGIFKESLGMDFRDPSVQQKYIGMLVSQYYETSRNFGDWHPTPL